MPDPITHTSLSYVIARHGFREYKGLFVLSALSPDIDVAIGGIYILLTRPPASVDVFFQESLIFHPSLTAAIWFIPLYGLMLSWVFRRFNQSARAATFKRIYKVVISGMLLHIGLDLMQTGNRLLWPLAWEAGFGILPYTVAGRIWPMVGAIGLLIVDTVVAYRLKRTRQLNKL